MVAVFLAARVTLHRQSIDYEQLLARNIFVE
jgi:hypothetical protein